MELRSYQKEAIAKALTWFGQGESNFRLNMITGSGKTTTAIALIEMGLPAICSLEGEDIYVACHTNNLATQFRLDVKNFPIEKTANWHVSTYQSLRKLKPTKRPLALIVDEAHQGGLEKAVDGSYAKIIKQLNPQFVICLTATDAGIDEKLFGRKTDENTFTYTLKDAIRDGTINDTEIITIHSGLRKVLVNETGEEAGVVEGEDLDDVGQQLVDKSVNLEDSRSRWAILNGVLGSAISTYLSMESGRQAVFYVPTIVAAKRGLEMLLAASPQVKATAVHSESTSANADIAAFKRGEFDVVFNVRQLQEGFNHPPLSVAFDCCPSMSNNGRILTQRIGRIVRRAPEKAPSRYYIVVGATTIKALFDVERVPEWKDVTPEDTAIFQEHINVQGQAQLIANMNMDKRPAYSEVSVHIPKTIEDVCVNMELARMVGDTLPEKVKVVRGGLLYVAKSAGEKIEGRVSLNSIVSFGAANPEENWEKIEQWVYAYGKLPSQSSDDPEERRLYILLCSKTSPASKSYDAEKRAWALQFGRRKVTPRKTKEQAIADGKSYILAHGHLPVVSQKSTKEERALGNCLDQFARNCPELREWIRKNSFVYFNREKRKKEYQHWVLANQRHPAGIRGSEEKRLSDFIYNLKVKYPEEHAEFIQRVEATAHNLGR